MTNTQQSFADKWSNNPSLAFDATLREGSDVLRWTLERNGFVLRDDFADHLADRRRILDAGCGNGRVTALLRSVAQPGAQIVGIDYAADEVARKNLSGVPNIEIVRKDILGDLQDLGTFDFIYCQEVLHHTKDPPLAFENLLSILVPGGEIAIYVYRQKAPLREFADDHVRKIISGLSYERAMELVGPITEIGRVLHETGIRIKVPDVEILGIEAGEYDLQRFIYHFFFKCYWNEEYSFHDNNVVNYDWYHPEDCSRHTLEEVRGWFSENGLAILHECVDHYGITVRGLREA